MLMLDVESLPLRLSLQLHLHNLYPNLLFTTDANQATLIVGPSNVKYDKQNIKLTDSTNAMVDDEYCVDVAPFPVCNDSIEHLAFVIGKVYI